jgi:transcriptional regulator with XRE-family HTH domain
MPQRRRRPHDTFALRLVALRHDLEMTQQEISDLVGVKRAAWNTWENGSIPQRQADIAKKISDATGYELSWLLYGGSLSDTPTNDDHPAGRLEVRILSQELQARRSQARRTSVEPPLRVIQTAA